MFSQKEIEEHANDIGLWEGYAQAAINAMNTNNRNGLRLDTIYGYFAGFLATVIYF